MIITNRNLNDNDLIKLSINNVEIEKVNVIKYLGVQIDDKLKFTKHIDYIEKKVAQKIGFMYRTCKYVKRNYKITVYRTIVEPHFTYCASIIYLCNIIDKERLQKLQNRAMRCILSKPRDTPIKNMLDELKWLSIKQACEYHALILIFKMKNNLLPKYLSSNLNYVHETHNINLRNKGNFRLPNLRKACSQNNVFYKGIKLFNESTPEMKNCDNLKSFKKLCYEFAKARPIRESTYVI